MRAHFGLPSVEAEDKEGKPPISVKFEIPYFTTSGIQVHPAHSPSDFCPAVFTVSCELTAPLKPQHCARSELRQTRAAVQSHKYAGAKNVTRFFCCFPVILIFRTVSLTCTSSPEQEFKQFILLQSLGSTWPEGALKEHCWTVSLL